MQADNLPPKIKGIFSVYGRTYEVEIKEWSEEIQGLSKNSKKINVWGYDIKPIPEVDEDKKRDMLNKDYDALMSIIKEHYLL